ncbi:hypothetical protein DFP72DRAFT_1139580 [Ephemerocybe angulata]|uniref:Uncharacterized protein n=1 Tax=Ephemerocybe angulata TaxID=980116 RepID=A0A8H6M301_9AGAR|nr:hypothetical protein DFP72DRAFT_1139580 [Tulosesus angulatus]
MSLFRPDLWLPELVDYPVQLLERPIFLADYIAAMLIATLFLGVQLIACGFILRQYCISRRQRKSKKGDHLLGRYFAVAHVGVYEKKEQSLEWLRQNPEHEGVKMICIPAASAPGGEELCHLFKYTKNLLRYKGLELAYSSLVEALILPVDAILIFRFAMIYSSSKLKNSVVGFLSALSLAGPIIGLVALGKIASLGANSDPWWSANFRGNRFLEWHSPWLAVVMPVIVNVVVTVAIIARIARTQRHIRKYSSMPNDKFYTGLTATLVESALPSALFGVLAAALHRAGEGNVERIKFSPTVLWVAFTHRSLSSSVSCKGGP